MATLTPTIKLVSTDTSTDSLSISVTDTLTVTQPMVDIAQISVGTSATEILTTSQAVRTYVYVKNAGATNSLVIKTAGGVTFAILAPGEVNFFTLYPDLGFELAAEVSTTTAEYGYWTKG